MNATYTKLRDGSWGIKLTGVSGTIPVSVLVTKRDGSTKQERIAKVLWRGDDAMICSLESKQKTHQNYGGTGYRMVKGCGACRQLGKMCKQCYFDEFDS